MEVDLQTALPIEPGPMEALDLFVSTCLAEAGMWDHFRNSDGVAIERLLERSADRLRLAGRIWSIDQAVHTFWLEVKRKDSAATFLWSLYFDVVEATPRRARNAVHDHDRPEDIQWRAIAAGEATIQDGVLRLVAGTARTMASDE